MFLNVMQEVPEKECDRFTLLWQINQIPIPESKKYVAVSLR